MLKFCRSSLLVILLAACCANAQTSNPPPADAPKQAEPALQMMTYQMVLFKGGPVKKRSAEQQGAMMQGHLANLARLNGQRINLIYGPFTDADPQTATMNDLRGIAVLDVADAETAKKHFADDPFVKAGEMVLEVKPWLGPKGWFSPPAMPASDDPTKMAMEPLIFGVLVRGPAAKANPPVHTMEQRQEFQKGHLAYMGELNKQGKLVMAGPFMEDGDWRGIVVYRVASVADAQALAANDPAVKAGRLAIEARSWMTLKGILK